IETGGINFHVALAAYIGCQIEREAVGVVQLKGGFTVEHLTFWQYRQRAVENIHALVDGLEETLLLLPQHIGDACPRLFQFGIGTAHFRNKIGNDPEEKRSARTEFVTVTNRAAN